jgi:hypothetical protein
MPLVSIGASDCIRLRGSRASVGMHGCGARGPLPACGRGRTRAASGSVAATRAGRFSAGDVPRLACAGWVGAGFGWAGRGWAGRDACDPASPRDVTVATPPARSNPAAATTVAESAVESAAGAAVSLRLISASRASSRARFSIRRPRRASSPTMAASRSVCRLSVCRLSVCRLSVCRLSVCRLSVCRSGRPAVCPFRCPGPLRCSGWWPVSRPLVRTLVSPLVRVIVALPYAAATRPAPPPV